MAQSATVKWNTYRPWLGAVIRLVLGVVWIWSASSKLGSPRTFLQAVRAYDATPEWLAKGIGYGLPVLELCIGIVLIVGVVVRIAAIASAALLVVFLIGIIQVAARGIQLDCGCFGGGGTTAGGTTYTLDILRDLGLIVLAAFLVMWPMTRLSLDEALGRKDYVEPPSAKRLRSDQGRRKYNAMLEMRRKEARSRNIWLGASLAGVIVLVSIIGIGVQANRAKIAGTLTAAHASVSNGVVFGKKAAATVDVYEDFQCPNCREYEAKVATDVDAAVRANKAQVRFHTLAFLDSGSGGKRYSTRAANATLCASDLSVEDFVAFHNVLFGKIAGKQVQPNEGTSGRTDTQLITYAKAAKISGNDLTIFTKCVAQEQHSALVAAITDHASQNGVNATPTVKVNGKQIDNTLEAFTKAVTKALKSGPKPNPSKTPIKAPSTPAKSPTSPVTTPSATGSTAAKSPTPTGKP